MQLSPCALDALVSLWFKLFDCAVAATPQRYFVFALIQPEICATTWSSMP